MMLPHFIFPPLIQRAAELTGSRPAEITGPCRFRDLVRTRWAIMLIAHRHGMGSSQIGRALGHRDHSTIITGIRRAKEEELADPDFASLVTGVEKVMQVRIAA